MESQRDPYEQSVLDYIGVREVAVTAKEEGRDERDAEHVKRLRGKGKSIAEISDTLDILESRVIEILQTKRGQ